MAALSVCTFTRDPAAAVALSLRRFRHVADEIVAVVDERADPRGREALRQVCDRVIVAPFQWPLEANLAWLEARCSGDWMLRIDGDEVPSTALLRRLSEGSWADGVTHVSIARRWLWRDATTMLDQAPWWLDPQTRLVRRGVADWPGVGTGAHGVPMVSGRSRLLVEPLYHLDLLVTATTERLARARSYEASSPGLMTPDGVNQNIGYYLPEARAATLRTRPVPDEDADPLVSIVDAFRGAGPAPARLPRAEGSDTSDTPDGGRVDPPPVRVMGRVDPGPRRGDVHLELFSMPASPLLEGSTAAITVTVRNDSPVAFTGADRSPVVVGARILDRWGRVVAPEARARLPARLEPGATETVTVRVGPQPAAGAHTIEVGALRERVAWFEPTLRFPVTVTRPRRVSITSGVSPSPHLGDDLIVATVLDALALHALDIQVVLLADDAEAAKRRFGIPAVPGASLLFGDVRDAAGAARVLWRLRADAARVAAGRPVRRGAHRELLENLAASDALVVLGAGWLAGRYRRSGIAPHLAEVEAARAMDLPVVFEAGSVGPFDGPVDRLAARRLLGSARSITVRDERSAATLRRLGFPRRRVRVVPDVATAYPMVADDVELHRWLRGVDVETGAPWAVVSLRAGSAVDPDLAAATVDDLDRAGVTTIFLTHHVGPAGDDAAVGRDLARRCRIVVPGDEPTRPVATALIRGASTTFGDRLHLALSAAAAGVPGVFVADDRYDRHRAAALAGSSVTVVGPAEVRIAVAAAHHRAPSPPGAVWDAGGFVERVARTMG